MDLRNAITFCGQHWNYFTSTLLLLSSFKEALEEKRELQRLLVQLRINLMATVMLVNGIGNSSLLFLLFSDNFRKGIFICCCLHSLSFLVFFLNVVNDPNLLDSQDTCEKVLKILFYGNLILNSISFILLTIFIIIVNLLSIPYPNIINRIRIMGQLNDLMFGYETVEERADPPLNDQELLEVRSQTYRTHSQDHICTICLEGISDTD